MRAALCSDVGCSPESLSSSSYPTLPRVRLCAEELAPVATCRPAAIGAQAIFIMLGGGAGEHRALMGGVSAYRR